MERLPLHSLFQFGTPALYLEATGKKISCRVFVDIGWQDAFSGYETHAAEMITIISVLLQEIPFPKAQDQIQIEKVMYRVISVKAEDDAIALLQVKKE
jgi:hypothetical protein